MTLSNLILHQWEFPELVKLVIGGYEISWPENQRLLSSYYRVTVESQKWYPPKLYDGNNYINVPLSSIMIRTVLPIVFFLTGTLFRVMSIREWLCLGWCTFHLLLTVIGQSLNATPPARRHHAICMSWYTHSIAVVHTLIHCAPSIQGTAWNFKTCRLPRWNDFVLSKILGFPLKSGP